MCFLQWKARRPFLSRRRALSYATTLKDPQFSGSVLYRFLGLGRLRAITFWPWQISDVPVDQLRKEQTQK